MNLFECVGFPRRLHWFYVVSFTWRERKNRSIQAYLNRKKTRLKLDERSSFCIRAAVFCFVFEKWKEVKESPYI